MPPHRSAPAPRCPRGTISSPTSVSFSDTDLAKVHAELVDAERTLSEQRHRVHDTEAVLRQELQRRYRDGLASTDELLTS